MKSNMRNTLIADITAMANSLQTGNLREAYKLMRDELHKLPAYERQYNKCRKTTAHEQIAKRAEQLNLLFG